MPTCKRRAIRQHRDASTVKTKLARPISVALARSITSSSESNRNTPATGPNISSVAIAQSAGTSVSKAGATYGPAGTAARVPFSRFAPASSASWTIASTATRRSSSITGPRSGNGSLIGSPILIACTFCANFSVNSSYTPAWTKNRFAATQDWPLLRNFATNAPSTAASTSASSNTMNAPFPPSSSSGCTTRSAALAMIVRPTAVEPVNVTIAVLGCSISASLFSCGGPCTRLITPSGIPASVRQLIISVTASGAFSDTRATTVHPAARAGASLRAWIEHGKFHGDRLATTPAGSRSTSCSRPETSEVSTSPAGRRASSANQRRYSIDRFNSPTASGSRLPVSRASRAAISWCRRVSTVTAWSKTSARSRAGRLLQCGSASRAASAAATASDAPPQARCPTTAPSAGLCTGRVVADPTHCPSISMGAVGACVVVIDSPQLIESGRCGRVGTGVAAAPGVASSLDRSCGDPRDEVALQEDVGQRDRHRGDHHTGEQQRIVREELTLEVQQRERDGFLRVGIDDQQGIQQVVPLDHEQEDRRSRHRWHGHRQHHGPVGP